MADEKIRLLIVDDEVEFLEALAERLAMRDFDVATVTGGEEALERARTSEYDLALVDLRMPGMSGQEVLETLKKEHPHMEVIILTGHGTVDLAVEGLRAGAYTFLQKPCSSEQLLDALTQAYKKRVEHRIRMQEQKLDELMSMATGGSPLGILRRLKDIDRGK